MKRFTVASAVFSVSILAVWAIFQIFTASLPKSDDTSNSGQPSHNEIMKAVDSGNKPVIPVTGSEARKVAPVFDSSGAIVSDPSGTLANTGNSGQLAIPVTGSNVMVAPVFDSSGAVKSDPSGTILNAPSSDGKIAPVFDANGNVVSDPSGTILNSSNP